MDNSSTMSETETINNIINESAIKPNSQGNSPRKGFKLLIVVLSILVVFLTAILGYLFMTGRVDIDILDRKDDEQVQEENNGQDDGDENENEEEKADVEYVTLEKRCSLGKYSTFYLNVIYPNTIEVTEERDCVYKLSYGNSYLLLGYEAEKSCEDYSVKEFSGEYEVIIENYRIMKPLIRIQTGTWVYEYGHFRGENPCYGEVEDCHYNFNQTDQFIYAPLYLGKVFLDESDDVEKILEVFDKVIKDSEIEKLDIG